MMPPGKLLVTPFWTWRVNVRVNASRPSCRTFSSPVGLQKPLDLTPGAGEQRLLPLVDHQCSQASGGAVAWIAVQLQSPGTRATVELRLARVPSAVERRPDQRLRPAGQADRRRVDEGFDPREPVRAHGRLRESRRLDRLQRPLHRHRRPGGCGVGQREAGNRHVHVAPPDRRRHRLRLELRYQVLKVPHHTGLELPLVVDRQRLPRGSVVPGPLERVRAPRVLPDPGEAPPLEGRDQDRGVGRLGHEHPRAHEARHELPRLLREHLRQCVRRGWIAGRRLRLAVQLHVRPRPPLRELRQRRALHRGDR